jgi:hypothetical protein
LRAEWREVGRRVVSIAGEAGIRMQGKRRTMNGLELIVAEVEVLEVR